MTQPSHSINSFDEWTRLEEVIVGDPASYTSHHLDTSFQLFYLDNVTPDPSIGRELAIPSRLVDELAEDVDGFVQALGDLGVRVLRPQPVTDRATICSPWWNAVETPPLNVRDQTIVLGDTIVETAPHIRGRVFENDYLKPLFYGYLARGCGWLAMPRPALARASLDTGYHDAHDFDLTGLVEDPATRPIPGLGHELIFDGAQCMRFGLDILVNIANANHRLGFDWLRRTLPQFRWHRLDAVADSHIDSIIVPLRPGLLMLRSPDYLNTLPEPLQRWDIMYPPEQDESVFPDYSDFGFNLTSRYIDINVLSVDEETVIVNSLCPDLMRTLEKHGLTVVPVQHRHRRLFGGGFHCFTLDTARAGTAEDYFA
ncbi:inosamine-phosphate amidinotransferase [Nocardia sp. BMG51109]|uniref:inosamine-phosphate amidinotransferase n=1 Tax=Nocardia sp. BMG51109 TaxID=1056816 RepID=UPI000465B4EF|nr:inosamine-phosphate amidinotransferase [Nocardia sp. BMG51109]